MRRELWRQRFVIFAAFAVTLAASGLAVERSRTTADAGERPVAGRLGPTPGPSADLHIARQKAYLERAASAEPSRPAAGLVSLGRLLTGAETATLVAGYEAGPVFVLFPGGQGEVLAAGDAGIEAAVAARASEIAAIRTGEAETLEAEAATAQPDERPRLLAKATEARNAAVALGTGCTCVYAFVVEHATLGRLQTLAGRPEVRLVDVPEPVVADLEGWQLTPIVPG